MNHLISLVREFSEVVDDGWLMGKYHDFVMIADAELATVWREIAPNQPVDQLNRAIVAENCIIFDVSDEAIQLYNTLKAQRPPGSVLSFLMEYYPSICAKTFAAGKMADEMGSGVIMFQTPRTGSHLMQGMIGSLGDFAAPDEWIRPPGMAAIRLGLLGLVDHLVRCARHQRAFHKYWSASIVLPFLVEMWPQVAHEEQDRFGAFVRESHPFLLTRRDRVAQTWSQIRAHYSGRFHVTSSSDVNRGIDPTLLPPEKFWLWIIANRNNFDIFENWARKIVLKSGKELAVICYEELASRPIPDDVHKRALGLMYQPEAHRLDAGSAMFVKQSSAEDEKVIATLTRMISEVDEVDFRRGWQAERAKVSMYDGIVTLDDGRLEARGGTVICEIPFEQRDEGKTVVLELEVLASQKRPVRLGVSDQKNELHSATITEGGAYVLLTEDRAIAGRRAYYRIGLGEGAQPSVPFGARVRLVAIYKLPVSFKIIPEFPWMESEGRTDGFALYRLV
jgi:hypothetical protein